MHSWIRVFIFILGLSISCLSLSTDIQLSTEGGICVTNSQCFGLKPYCKKSLKKCVQCLTSTNCKNPKKPYCHNGICEPCSKNANCPKNHKCVKGQCLKITSSICPKGKTKCSGVCVNLKNNKNHCGTCGHKCPQGKHCYEGKCVKTQSSSSSPTVSTSSTCASPRKLCGSNCVDLSINIDNCGSCNHVCPAGENCSNGECEIECYAPTSACGQHCYNLQINLEHCGSCYHSCPAGFTCINGTCACSPPDIECGETCVNLETNSENCNACFHRCNTNVECFEGECLEGEG